MKRVLVTGGAGFIGFHTLLRLVNHGYYVEGADHLEWFLGSNIKYHRRDELARYNIPVKHFDVNNASVVDDRIAGFDYVIHLAALPGVRYSAEYPSEVLRTNVVGTMNVLNACRRHGVKKVLYASSSSVYAGNTKQPFAEDDPLSPMLSYYATSKRMNEMQADVFAAASGMPIIGMRFFTVFGPWGRPDMAIWKFTDALFRNNVITMNGQDVGRDFTYVDDVTNSIRLLLEADTQGHEIVNVGSGRPRSLDYTVAKLAEYANEQPFIEHRPLPATDPQSTHCDIRKLARITNYVPSTPFDQGLKTFVNWYWEYAKCK